MQSKEIASEARMERLVKAVQSLSTVRCIADIQEIVRHAAREISGADGATFVLKDGDKCYYADEDAIEPLWKGKRFPLEACISGWAMLNRTYVAIEDIYKDPRIPADAYRPTFVKSLVMVPIRSSNPIGAIGTYWAKNRSPVEQEIKMLQALADTTSVAFENVEVLSTLEKKVEQRTAELEYLNRELESFSSSISHDLRSPLRAISSFSKILMSDHVEELSEDARRLFDRICFATDQMGSQIEGLLDLSRVSKAQIQRVEVDLSLLAREICETCKESASKEVTFVVADNMKTEGDPRLLRAALENLISNAFKFSSKVPTPRVEIGMKKGDKEGYDLFFIKDNGAGFDPKYASKLFGTFQRLHSENDFPGTGIGLATVQRIITRHLGSIWAESTLGEGATFFFSLPQSELQPEKV